MLFIVVCQRGETAADLAGRFRGNKDDTLAALAEAVKEREQALVRVGVLFNLFLCF